MAKVEYGEWTAWEVHGTPRFMKDGKVLKTAHVPEEMKQKLTALLEEANGKQATQDTPEPAPEAPTDTMNPGIGEEPIQTIADANDVDVLRRQIEEMKANQEAMLRIFSQVGGAPHRS